MRVAKEHIYSFIHRNPDWQWFFESVVALASGKVLKSWRISKEGQNKDFLFIVGSGRSGNTLLRRLLMDAYSIYIPPETYVLKRQIVEYVGLPENDWEQKVDVAVRIMESHKEFKTFGIDSFKRFSNAAKAWPAERRSFSSLIDGIYRYIGVEAGYQTQWVGDKTPLNTLSLGIIRAAFPNAKFVYLERDPIDVISSYLKSDIYDSPRKAAQRWKTSVVAWENFKRGQGSDSYIEMRYENLVREPQRFISLIGCHFDIPASDGCEIHKRLGDVELYDHHSGALKPPSISSIGKGRAAATEALLAEVRPIVLGLALSRGYDKF